MLLLPKVKELRSYLASQRQSRKIGLVPTMGALHKGHISLIKKAIAENELVVVSIFVNPLQFTPTEDLQAYPRQLESDCQQCEKLGVEVVFAPTAAEIGITGDTDSQSTTTIVVPPVTMTSVLCGKYRPGHFVGVATIVTKLLNIVQPDRAYFGEKDFQQLAIVRRLVRELNFPVEIVGCPIIRESSGLALSSRNQYLTKTEKQKASVLYSSLQAAKQAFNTGIKDASSLIELVKKQIATVPEVKLQYAEIVDPQTLQPLEKIEQTGLMAIAAYVNSTRLIDNIMLRQRQPIIAIDGPAGAGKSTVTRKVARQLDLLYLDTGAMYRAVTWLVMESGINLDDEKAIASLIEDVKIDLIPPNAANLPPLVYVNDREVTQEIRTPEVTANVSKIAAMGVVREQLVKQQQKYGEKGGIIAEGRDIGTNVFPNAELKIFLTASVRERARRRWQDLQNQGREDISIEQLAKDIQKRDEQDSNRAIAPLKQAEDAIEIVTDDLSVEEVVDRVINLYARI
ncbi:MAG: bifunctional pantoate--beta-alanine ligase/(d)CMP kinase [Xenococcaceae cyanobacterium]